MHEVLVNRLGGLSLPRESVARLTDRPDMTLDVYRERKTTLQQQQNLHCLLFYVHILDASFDRKTKLFHFRTASCKGLHCFCHLDVLLDFKTRLFHFRTVKVIIFGVPI